MRTRLFALLAVALLGLFSHAQALAVEITLYYPVAVGGAMASKVGQLVADFEREHPGISVTPIYAGTYKETLAKALTAHKGGTPPDVAVLFAADMYTLVDADAIVSYDELAAQGTQGQQDKAWLGGFYPALMANSRAGGKTWGIPFQRSTILLYWNKDLFAKAGLNPNQPPVTWAEMTAFAQKLTVRDGDGKVSRWGIQIPSSGFPYWLFQGFTTANSAELMNAAGTETYFDQPAAVSALQYWVDLARVHKVHPPGIVEWGTTPDDFLAQRAAMIWTTSGNLGNIKASASFDFGVAMLPANKRHGSPTGGGNLYVFKKGSVEFQVGCPA
jgi:sn-glycerol 3-phosphate transport system substrate-binding protein